MTPLRAERLGKECGPAISSTEGQGIHNSTLRLLLLSVCGFTALSGLWLGVMGLRLKHPGYAEGEVISGIIVTQALLTVAALWFCKIPILLDLSAIGCLTLFWLASKALKGLIDGSHFEGYILLIALALVVQAIFTLAILIAERNRPKTKHPTR